MVVQATIFLTTATIFPTDLDTETIFTAISMEKFLQFQLWYVNAITIFNIIATSTLPCCADTQQPQPDLQGGKASYSFFF